MASAPISPRYDLELDPARHVSPLGNIFIAVVMAAGQSCQIDNLRLYAEPTWNISTIDGPETGFFFSPAMVDGNPAVAYADLFNYDLKYARSSTPTGSASADWTIKLRFDTPPDTDGEGVSLAVIDGNPAISFQKFYGPTELRYMRSLTTSGAALTDWPVPLTIDSQNLNLIASRSSLREINGGPAIAYTDIDAHVIKYVRSSTPDGTSIGDWSVPITAVSNEDGLWSLQLVDGHPAIHLMHVESAPITDSRQLFVRATTSTGESPGDWPAPLSLASGRIGQFALIGGYPAIAYSDEHTEDLMFIRSSTLSGSNLDDWQAPLMLDTEGNVGYGAALATVGGFPFIVYRDLTRGYIRAQEATTAEGGTANDWTGYDVVPGASGSFLGLMACMDVHGKPGVFYGNENGELMYAIQE